MRDAIYAGLRAVATLGSAMMLAVLAGCGSPPTNVVHGSTLTIYASLPLHGASAGQAVAIRQGAELALAENRGRIPQYTIVLKALDDSTAARGTWDPGQTEDNAHLAASDKTTIGYIGEFDSGASAISIPILNRADIPQISPASTAIGLTTSGPGSVPGEPQKYYPTGKRTFARIVPNDAVQSAVQVALQKSEGCAKTFVLADQDVYGQELANSFVQIAKSHGLTVAGEQGYSATATDYRDVSANAAATHPDCVFISGTTAHGAVALTEAITNELPKAKVFAPDGVADSAYVDPVQGGLPVSVDPRLAITIATLAPREYPAAGRTFFDAYTRRYGQPQPYAIFGYEAMSLMLDAIGRATRNGQLAAERSKVLSAIFATRDRRGALGAYSIESDGDTTLKRYGVYRVVAGRLQFWRAVGE